MVFLPSFQKNILAKTSGAFFIGLFMASMPLSAAAYTECNVTPHRFFVGSGILELLYSEGGSGVLSQADPNFKAIYTVFVTAIAMQQRIIVRYDTDVSCGNIREMISGVWMLRQ